MLKLFRLLLFAVFLPGLAWAQSSPGLFNGQVPTAQQWNSYFQKKQDYPVGGYCPDGSIYANFTGAINTLRCTPNSGLPVGSAAKWTTARNLTVTGAINLSIAGIDGSANFSGVASLPNSGVTAGSFICTNFTVNAGGLITAASSGSCLATSGASILKGNGSGGLANAVAGTDYAPATSGSSILAGNGAGGTTPVTIGVGLKYAGGILKTSGQLTVVQLQSTAAIPNNDFSTNYSWSMADIIQDDVGAWNSGSPTNFTIPVGVCNYRLTVQASWASNNTGGRWLYLKDNGTIVLEDTRSALTETAASAISAWIPATSSHNLTVLFAQTSGGALNVNGGYTRFQIEWKAC